MGLTPEFLQRYQFNWEILDVIIGGKSAIDTADRLSIKTLDDVHRFLEAYGYDLENPIEKAELFGNFQEALSFIRRYFLQPENPEGVKLEIPRKIMELTDISQLLLLVGTPTNQNTPSALSLWACAIIKIMHTIAHMDKDLRANYFTDIQTQILDRFYKFIHSDEDRKVFLGHSIRDTEKVDLVLFESKPKKGRDSILLKLLHKPENVAEDIFDRVGIRFVTKNKFDALRTVKFLKDRYVIMPANIKPSRSRNTLIHVKTFSVELDRLLKEVDAGKLTPGDLDQKLIALCEQGQSSSESTENPHTSRDYSSIQFTCRQLIKIKNPLFDEIKLLKSAMKGKTLPEEINKIIDRLDLRNLQREIRFFYPFEVQVYDEQSHQENLAGRSSHTNYKKSQIQAAMRRVLGGLLKTPHA